MHRLLRNVKSSSCDAFRAAIHFCCSFERTSLGRSLLIPFALIRIMHVRIGWHLVSTHHTCVWVSVRARDRKTPVASRNESIIVSNRMVRRLDDLLA